MSARTPRHGSTGITHAGPDYDHRIPSRGYNKWYASVLALAAADGKIKWVFQYKADDPIRSSTRSPSIRSSNTKVNGRGSQARRHVARKVLLLRTTLDPQRERIARARQEYTDHMTWTTASIRRPASRSLRSHQATCRPTSWQARFVSPRPKAGPGPSNNRRQDWPPRPSYNHRLNRLFIHLRRNAAIRIETVEQKSFVDPV